MRNFLKSGRAVATAVALASVCGFAACSNLKDNLLEAPDPDIIDPSSVNSPNGANAVRVGALARFRLETVGDGSAGEEGTWLIGGLLADEWSTSSTFVQNDELDERQITLSNSTVTGSLRNIYRGSTDADQAIALLKQYRPSPSSDIAEMYLVKGFSFMTLAQDFCNGIPISTVSGTDITVGSPNSITEVFQQALAAYDSGLALATGTDAASITIRSAINIAKARTLLSLSLDNAATAVGLVAGIPTTYAYNVTSSTTTTANNNGIWQQGASQRRYSVGDSLEGNAHSLLVKNAIPFFSSGDPRIQAQYTISGKDTTKGQDGLTFSRTTKMYGQVTAIAAVNGIDARFVEAEAALKAGDVGQMLSILNALRATTFKLGEITYTANQLPPLTDPGSADARVNLLFREKAFWTFSRGQRLNDLRRLVREYHRTADQVFPTGTHYRNTAYGPDVNLPVTSAEKNGNPNFGQCTDRNP